MRSKQRIAVEIAREDLDQAIVALERATRRETETRLRFTEALDKLEREPIALPKAAPTED